MPIITVDFETYYNKDYSLRKMTPVEYVRSPLFETIGCAVKENGGTSTFLTPEELRRYLMGLPPKVHMLSHNALFDMCVMAWRYGYVPDKMICSMSMARAMIGAFVKGVSLERVLKYLELGTKGKVVQNVIGMRRADIIANGWYDRYAAYSCDDCDGSFNIFVELMRRGFPKVELDVMDRMLRAAVIPKFQLDPNKLAEHAGEVAAAKVTLLDRTGMTDKADLMSNDKFAAALRMLGVEPPMKISKQTGQPAYAFAKTDIDFINLDEHENPDVQALVAARLGFKSTLEETRTARFISISNLNWGLDEKPVYPGFMPIPLRFSGAHTHRFSGDWKLNMQNLRRGGKLRDALKAPKGKVVITVDASQVEARKSAVFCGQDDLVRAFAIGEDVYSTFAGKVYGFVVNKKDHPTERFVGKQAVLGLGYNLGWLNFAIKLRTDSRNQTGNEINLSDEESKRVVNLYRGTNTRITAMWKTLGGLIPEMCKKDCDIQLGPVRFVYQAIVLPNGLKLHYHNLRFEENEWKFDYGPKTKRLYGGKLLENIIQALARIHVMECDARVMDRFTSEGIFTTFALQAHDELVYVVPENKLDIVKPILLEEMRRAPIWMPTAPLDAEFGYGKTYGDAK